MMCFTGYKGTFPFEKDELKTLCLILSEKILNMENDMDKIDPHKFVEFKQLEGKLNGYVCLMDYKKDVDKKNKVNVNSDGIPILEREMK